MSIEFESVDEAYQFLDTHFEAAEGQELEVEAQEVEVKEPARPSSLKHRRIRVTPIRKTTLDAIEQWGQPILSEELAELLGIAHGAASQRLVALREQGLVERIAGTWRWQLSQTAIFRGWEAA